jgi:leader peptidase (prepilin peptidase)/N-methyltransferase
MSADPHEIRRVGVGDGIYMHVTVPAAESEEARPHAWRLGPAAGVVAAGLAAVALLRLGATPHGLLAAGVLAVLVVLGAIDLQARVVPNRIVGPATAAVLAWQLAFFPGRALEWLVAALGAAVFMALPSLVRPGALGMGDVKLALLLGAALGGEVLGALTLGCVAVLPVALVLMARRDSRLRGATVPFAPFLAFGAAVVLLV